MSLAGSTQHHQNSCKNKTKQNLNKLNPLVLTTSLQEIQGIEEHVNDTGIKSRMWETL